MLSNRTRLFLITVIVSGLSFSSLLLLRHSVVPTETLPGGWGSGLDASRQHIVDTGRIYDDPSFYSYWYFPRLADQQLALLNAILSLTTGTLDPVSAASLFSYALYPTLFLVLLAVSWCGRVARSLASRMMSADPRPGELLSYALFSVFPSYTLVRMEIASYPGFAAMVFLFFFVTLLLKRAGNVGSKGKHAILLTIVSFALFNMYHTTAIEVAMMLVVILAVSFAIVGLRPARNPIVMMLAMYLAVGLYQNLVLIYEPIYVLRYLGDIRAATEFTIGVSFNQVGFFGDPATRLLGGLNVVIIGALALLAFYSLFRQSSSQGKLASIETLSKWILLATGIPMVLLFAYGDLGFVLGRFKDQLLVWVLVPVLPIAFLAVSGHWRRVFEILMIVGIAASIVGSFAAADASAQTYLSSSELQTAHFIWNEVPDSEFVFTDWIRGTSLMYYHRYIYGPDPYRMPGSFFTNITVELYYEGSSGDLRELIASALGTQNFSVYLSSRMISSGPTGPDYSYSPASANLFAKFDYDPGFNLVYSTEGTILLQSRG